MFRVMIDRRAKSQGLTTALVCDTLGISKSTLFRWEREGLIPPPARDQLRNRQRQYSAEDFKKLQARLLKGAFASAFRENDLKAQTEALETLYVQKAVAGDPVGIEELRAFAAYQVLSASTTKHLLRFAYENLETSDPDFESIVRVVLDNLVKLRSAAREGE
jgi:hypothetical protein